jgi:hypothetical protein
MEQEPIDHYLAHVMKKELFFCAPPANGRSKLLSQAVPWSVLKSASGILLSKRSQELYRVQVYCGSDWFEQVDNLIGSIEFRLLNYQHLVA